MHSRAWDYVHLDPFGSVAPHLGASHTLVPIRPRSRGERRFLRTFAGASLRPPLAFNPRPRRLSTPSDAFQLHPDVRSYGTTLRRRRRESAARGDRERVRDGRVVPLRRVPGRRQAAIRRGSGSSRRTERRRFKQLRLSWPPPRVVQRARRSRSDRRRRARGGAARARDRGSPLVRPEGGALRVGRRSRASRRRRRGRGGGADRDDVALRRVRGVRSRRRRRRRRRERARVDVRVRTRGRGRGRTNRIRNRAETDEARTGVVGRARVGGVRVEDAGARRRGRRRVSRGARDDVALAATREGSVGRRGRRVVSLRGRVRRPSHGGAPERGRARGRAAARGSRRVEDALRRARGEDGRERGGVEVRSIHWSPYDRVGVVDADP
ncbi:uncharacterized protein MICPUCDRAFT_61934 [Micromonas pusilla CCMP1545]|uniref:Predicted protein n=1 Tax=Micromonas pusilla (strain CCMP1545) TaxID=564608 RepID=C1MNF6_MICPC|nr:uncharacterized protein MICPUCDRAFT_61934 [Micromonas pusilla CCMP1545]EEH58741.1 predicted protein [Micromonas pusilla CCMP1545]|eukprot:XP_003057096.1 predicted protein [Micromonas pusilla CCMP1545]